MASSRYYDDFTLNEDENEKTNESLEDFDMTVLPIESVIGSELENFNIFFTQDLSNAIQKIKREKQISSSDASVLLKFLLKQQKEEPIMFVQPLINVDSDRLCGIFWMTANQIDLWSRYSDVILHDNTSRTNKYNYPLSLFILVDNNGKSCLEIQAFLNDEKQESYERILKNT
ncbi:hypothetical protein RhiirC2_721535 [Rhizophagus irregularis]|uniref:ZSWIM1/3 RNaseH-like domain-containing protein n=1 Tax=Rhizophagus irregularis TaxID=588596 RepID=A0A2N1M5P2_9GLOM|nr:hypothetical protein RhiirC2_721535 [Rhizophagus irregularis]